jgi:hypothetical protein
LRLPVKVAIKILPQGFDDAIVSINPTTENDTCPVEQVIIFQFLEQKPKIKNV